MKAADVVLQLRKILPLFTDMFTTVYDISSLTKSGDVVTATTSSPHNIPIGGVVRITGALTPFDVTELTSDGEGTASVTTLQTHDFTQGYPSVAELINADQSDYNGQIISRKRLDYKQPLPRNRAIDRELLSRPNRKQITYAITGTPVTPATGSNIRIIQNFAAGYNGVHQVTGITSDTFTYEVAKDLGSPAEGNNIRAHTRPRISHLVEPARMIESYTKQPPDNAWAYIILGASNASRDVYTNSDLLAEYMWSADYRQTVDQDFSVLVILPTKQTIGAGDIVDFFNQEMNKWLIKSLVGIKFQSAFTNDVQYMCICDGNSPFLYTGAYYIHEYRFRQSYYLTLEDAADIDTSVAFLDLELKIENDTRELTDDKVNLDDEPIT